MINHDFSRLELNIEGGKEKGRRPRRRNLEMGSVKVFSKRVLLSLFLLASFFVIIFLFFSDRDAFLASSRYLFSLKRKSYIYDTFTISFEKEVPEEFKNLFVDGLKDIEFNGKNRFAFKDKGGDFVISLEEGEGKEVVYSKDFIPVGHLYSLTTNIGKEDLGNKNVYMLDGDLKDFLEKQYGMSVSVLDSREKLVSKLAESDNNIALVSFGTLGYDLKVIPFDGKYYLDNREGGIALRFYSSVKDEDAFILPVMTRHIDSSDGSFDSERLAKVNMGGVVAISRNLARKMINVGSNTYPADGIGKFLADADLTHVSNEASFVPGCTPTASMTFCTKPEHIEVLKLSGVDIVELTGNHNNDYGSKYSASTIETYKDLGWRYFGGGLDSEDASKILYEEVKGSKIAFLGYNYYDSVLNNYGPLAGKGKSGANAYSEEKVKKDIAEAKKNADIVIVSFQFQECYCYPDGDVIYPICYKPLSSPDQKGVFRKAIDLGANIVVGTQAHQPQTYELYNDGVIFYGLGNLFFDQHIWIGTRQGLILTHYFYEGKHIQTKVVPIYMGKDFKVNLATKEQGDLLLKLLKEAR
ncbi:MAG: CapA family protein [Candidatus Dojkabacteria bacterium]|jgi:poly-gamma-glutamate capsule biosynthesis protein CapA/YwtB (metallophosphatase superfamily)